MASPERKSLARIRAEVIPLVAAIPKGCFTTYGSLARHLGVNPRLVAAVLARLDEREAEILPWHRVVAAEGRISRGMAESIRIEQALRLEAEGLFVDKNGFLLDPDASFHVVGRSGLGK